MLSENNDSEDLDIVPFGYSPAAVDEQFRPKSRKERLYRAYLNFLANVADSSRRKYTEALKDFFQYTRIDDPDKVRFEDVIAYREHLNGRGLSACTAALRMSALRSLYKHLHEENLVRGNPFSKCRLPKVPRESKASCLTKEQAKMLLSAPDRSTLIGVRDHLILSLLLYNVLRRGGIVDIKKGDFRQEGKYYVLWYSNKGDEQVKTKIKPLIAEIAANYIISLKEYGYYPENKDYLFFRIRGSGGENQKLSGQSIYNIVKKYSEMGFFAYPPQKSDFETIWKPFSELSQL